ncbi:hypothetical protein DL238_00990 [Alteriqipengyuania lutimaris]|uniref:Anti-sigma factor NepR domain-containing protein n=1 Tax=Alteriqipengyuania lutimaris TaxID=1538146 RepID=A0A395LHD3_9SPHN|nr:NepR family anti-sigma factor [Alteriqipengyuania lutimaris]MBB3034836.1 hypothetical protein [Alteriqipengyuania lutimaris]RDS76326.1 hypothetical protein DL238_00990 [Alteriqipengyuania lutimaris]
MDDKHNPDAKHAPHRPTGEGRDGMNQPQWADSLRNLYDSVVDEPIPDSFKDLLDQFDEPKKDGPKQDGGDAT